MRFDGPRVDAWNLFTVTVQVGPKLRATRTTKHSCQRALYSKKMTHQSLGGQNVCYLFRMAFELEVFLLFNLANEILQANFSCKEMTSLNLFYITNGYESNRSSHDKQLELWGEIFFISIPSINDVWNSQYSTIKLNLTLKFWKSWIWRKNLDFFLFWRRTGMIIRLKWGYPYIGI